MTEAANRISIKFMYFIMEEKLDSLIKIFICYIFLRTYNQGV